jgi:hypothetical protein
MVIIAFIAGFLLGEGFLFVMFLRKSMKDDKPEK